MKKKIVLLVCTGFVFCLALTGCQKIGPMQGDTFVQMENQAESTAPESEVVVNTGIDLEDGVYHAKFDTDSGMFHVNEACEGIGVLTVENGQATIHVSLASVNILNLYPGLAEDAQKEGAELLQPTTDTVKYQDGTEEEVFGFDIPVPYLDEEFDVALVGKKGTWYDHKVSVSEVVPVTE